MLLLDVGMHRQNWRKVAERLGQTDDAVRNRYTRLVQKCRPPSVSRREGDVRPSWTLDEDATLRDHVATMGTKWKAIARLMPQRSLNSIRNRYARMMHGAPSNTPPLGTTSTPTRQKKKKRRRREPRGTTPSGTTTQGGQEAKDVVAADDMLELLRGV